MAWRPYSGAMNGYGSFGAATSQRLRLGKGLAACLVGLLGGCATVSVIESPPANQSSVMRSALLAKAEAVQREAIAAGWGEASGASLGEILLNGVPDDAAPADPVSLYIEKSLRSDKRALVADVAQARRLASELSESIEQLLRREGAAPVAMTEDVAAVERVLILFKRSETLLSAAAARLSAGEARLELDLLRAEIDRLGAGLDALAGPAAGS